MLQWGNSVGIARAVEGTSPALICVYYELTTVSRHSQAQLAEFNRFKMEDVPPRLETKQRLLRLFDEIQVSMQESQDFVVVVAVEICKVKLNSSLPLSEGL